MALDLRRVRAALDASVSSPLCFASWVLAVVVNLGIIKLLGGPSEGDLAQSAYSTWMAANGRWRCLYPPMGAFHGPPIVQPEHYLPPVYPLLSGALWRLTHLHGNLHFPTTASMGPGCRQALAVVLTWSERTNAALTTTHLAYLAFPLLLGGVVACVRACGLGRQGWEVLSVLVIATLPTLWLPITQFFHPQDLVALGAFLGALAALRRERLVLAGVLLGLGVLTQQFVLLIALSLAVLCGLERLWRLALGATLTVVAVALPLVLVTDGQALLPTLIGTAGIPVFRGTLLWHLGLPTTAVLVASRLGAILLSVGIALWARRRLGAHALDPGPLLSVACLALAARYLFEVSFFGYYLAIMTALLVLADLVRRRLRLSTFGFVLLGTVVFNPVPFGFQSNAELWSLSIYPYVAATLLGFGLLVALGARMLLKRWNWPLLGFLVAGYAVAGPLPWHDNWYRHVLTPLQWQVLFLPAAFALAGLPLLADRRHAVERDLDPTPPAPPSERQPADQLGLSGDLVG